MGPREDNYRSRFQHKRNESYVVKARIEELAKIKLSNLEEK